MAKTNNNLTEVLISDTGDDAQGEAELAFALRDTPDEADCRVTGGEHAHQVMLLDTNIAVEEMAEGAAPSTWNAMKAAPYYYRTTNYLLSWGVIDTAKKDRLNALIKGLETHGEVFSAQIALLAYELALLLPKAQRNFDRLLKAETFGYMEANKGWISCVLGVAQGLKNKYSSALPGEVRFDAKVEITDLERDNLHRIVSCLAEISQISTCKKCGEWVKFSKTDHKPYAVCKDCREVEREISEMHSLNLKLAEKKELLRPVENLLVDLTAAANGWVVGEVARGWLKAQVAFDNNFGSTLIAWHTKKVADIDVSIVTGKITDVDRAAVEAEKGYLMKVIEEIRTFKHLTYCPTCFMPTYPMAGYHGATKPCETCQSSSRKAAATDDGDLKDLAEAAQDAGVGLTSADGRVLAVAEVTAPAFDPGGKYMDAWQRNLSGKKKDESKKEKREKGEKKEKKVK